MFLTNYFGVLRNKAGEGGEGSGGTGNTDTGDQGKEDSDDNSPEAFAALQASYDKEVGLRRGLETQLGELKTTQTKLQKDLQNLNREKAKAGDPKDLEKWEKDKEAEIRSALQKELDDAVSAKSSLETQLNELTVVNAGFDEVRELFNDDCHSDVKELIRRHGKKQEDGTVIYQDEKGSDLYSPADRRKFMNHREFGEYIANRKPSWAKPKGKGGGRQEGNKQQQQTSGGNNGNVKPPPAGFTGWSQKDQQAWMTENPESARAFMRSRFGN